MVSVSVNAYNDAELLDQCLKSVVKHLPNARIQVVDGKYSTWPNGTANSEDGTADVAAQYDAEYLPIGPVADERSKHCKRLALAPDHERVLFIDADERLLTFDADAVADESVGRVRIFNALMYGPRISYYPRWFYPGQMESIPRVDRFSFDAPVTRTDAITIVHRADLRDDAYRDAKLERFEATDRDSWYREYLQSLGDDDVLTASNDATFERCPNCGRPSVTRSRVCGHGDDLTEVVTCTAGDSCYRAVESASIDEYRYLPDAVAEGFAEDVPRVRAELVDAGWHLAAVVPTSAFGRYEPNARQWVREHMDNTAHP